MQLAASMERYHVRSGKDYGPGRPIQEIPITHVTNGVHAPTWIAPLLRDLYERFVATDWEFICEIDARWENGIAQIPADELWNAHLRSNKTGGIHSVIACCNRRRRMADSSVMSESKSV